jgi:hypothetical protein
MVEDLIKNKIYLDKNIAHEKTQFLVEGDIIVSDVKPDVTSVLQTSENFVVDKNEILDNKINISGKLNLNVLYKTKDKESIYSIAHLCKLNEYVNIDNINKDSLLDLKSSINKIDYKILNDRKINFRAVVDLDIGVYSEKEIEVVVGIKEIPEAQITKQKINLNRLVDSRFDRFLIKDEFNLETGKPNILEILEIDAEIINRDTKIFDGKINSSGEIILKIIYKPDLEEKDIIEVTEHEINFNGVFDVPKAKDFMQSDLKLFVQEKNINIKTNQDGEDRLINCEIFVGANIKLFCNQELEILKDAYEINKNLELIQEKIDYQNIVCKTKSQVNLKELIDLDKSLPEINNIIKINAVPFVDDTHISQDKLIIEGFVNLDVLYLNQIEESKVYNYKTILPFRYNLETPGALPDMIQNVDMNIERISFNNINQHELEVRLISNINACVKDNTNLVAVKDIKIVELDKKTLDQFASITIYVVQEDDNLWEIAKKYNTSLDKLKELNNIIDESDLKLGQKLLIVK